MTHAGFAPLNRELLHRRVCLAVIRRLQLGGDVHRLDRLHRQAPDHVRRSHFKTNRLWCARRDLRQFVLAARGRKRQHRDVLKRFLKLTLILTRRHREFAIEVLPPAQPRLRRYNITHRLGGFHPRPARLTPAGRIEKTDVHPQPTALADGVLDETPPLIRQRLGFAAGGDAALAGDDANVTFANADPFHRLQIACDAFFCNLAVHPIPVAARLGGFRRLDELGFQRPATNVSSKRTNYDGEHQVSDRFHCFDCWGDLKSALSSLSVFIVFVSLRFCKRLQVA